MKRIGLVATVALLVTLTGCAPSLDDALQECLNETMSQLRAEGREVTADLIRDVREICAEVAEEDPERFIEVWTN